MSDAPPGEGLPASARIIRNVLILGAGQVFTWASAAGLAVLLPRLLGDVDLGRLSLAFAVTELCGMLASLGIGTYITKEVARDEQVARAHVLNAVLMRLPLALLASMLALLAATVLGYEPLVRELIALYCVSIALSAVAGVLTGALQGIQAMRAVTLANAASKMLLLGLIALLLTRGYGAVGVALAWDLSAVVGVALLLQAARRRQLMGGRPNIRSWLALFKGGMPFFLWEASLLVYGRMDVVLLSFFASAAVIGWYGAAYRVIGVSTFVPSIIMTAVFPALMGAARRDPAAFEAIARRALSAVLLAVIPVALGIMLLPDKLIAALAYPDEFRNSIPLIVILVLHIPVVGADMIIGTALNALDRQRRWALTGLAAAMLNPALNVVLIPATQSAFGNGAIGAAVVTVLTELFMLGMGLYLLRGAIFGRADLFYALRCLGAGLLMAALVWLVRDLPLPPVIAFGAVVYGLASLALGTLSIRDIRVIRTYMVQRARVGPVAAP